MLKIFIDRKAIGNNRALGESNPPIIVEKNGIIQFQCTDIGLKGPMRIVYVQGTYKDAAKTRMVNPDAPEVWMEMEDDGVSWVTGTQFECSQCQQIFPGEAEEHIGDHPICNDKCFYEWGKDHQ
tara:strand:- start:259 stop:630 length:372 start_codon:yes stop_codon:yes gene_type:complete